MNMSMAQAVLTVGLAAVAGLLAARRQTETQPEESPQAFEVVGGRWDGLRVDVSPPGRRDILRVVVGSGGDVVVHTRGNRADTAATLHAIASCIAEGGEDQ